MTPLSIAVIGSLNVDFITRTSRIPEAGETLTATSFETGLGGKGANQAVACARLAASGTKVSMVGNVGDDSFGSDYITALAKEGIITSGVRKVEGQKTGIANIIVEEANGENRILLATGANHASGKSHEKDWDLVPDEAGICVFQLEIPLKVVLHNMRKAREQGKHVIFNPAPAIAIPDVAYRDIDTLIMNETEARLLAGAPRNSNTSTQAELSPLLRQFLSKGVRDAVIITLGGEGVLFATQSGEQGHVDAVRTQVVDTTAAGDTFLGGYAAKLAENGGGHGEYHGMLAFASMAASKTVARKGAMVAIPTRHEVLIS
ncbi:putative ribokinase [Oleoguttula sp. CCFEE 5521]